MNAIAMSIKIVHFSLMIFPALFRIAILVIGLLISHVAQAQGSGPILKQNTSNILASEGFTFSVPKGWDTEEDIATRRFILMAPGHTPVTPMIWLTLKRDSLELSTADAMGQYFDRVRKSPGTEKVELTTVKRSAGGTFSIVTWEEAKEGVPFTWWNTILRLKGNGRVFVTASCRTTDKEAHRAAFLAFLASIKGDQP